MAFQLVSVLYFLMVVSSSNALKCYGAEAFERMRNGESDCYHSLADGVWEPCWTKCGGVNFFVDEAGENPSGKELCPYRKTWTPDYISASPLGKLCKCSMWRHPLPGGKCPKCDDYESVAPLMMINNRDAAAAGIKLGECPPGYDTCFNYCVEYSSLRLNPRCFFGCSKLINKPIMELMISAKLAELYSLNNKDDKYLNPVYFECEGSSTGCSKTYCNSDGCNRLSIMPKLPGRTMVYVLRAFAIFFTFLMLCIFILKIYAACLKLRRPHSVFMTST